MSIATQIERLQGVRDQIRTKMVGLGLSENTDLLQNLADDLDGVDKISPTNNGTTDPGTGYTNVDTLSRSTSTRYIKVPKGYNDTNRKFTISGVANGVYSASVSSHTISNAAASSSVTGSVTNVTTTTKPAGTDGTDYYTITPKLSTTAGSSKATGKATIDTAGYLAAGNKSSSESSKSVGVTASQGDNYYLKAGAYSASVSSHTTTNATASSKVSGSIVNITSATKPSTGNDGADYFTITPKLTTAAGSSKATGKATVDTAGYLATGNTTSEESSKSVGVTASQGSSYYLKAGSYSASVASHEVTDATAGSSVAGSITNITSTTKPSAGTDGTNYYTITPKLTTGNGSSKATGKATISANGFLGVSNKTSSESSKSVGVAASQGVNYYLPAGSYSASVASHTTSNATASSSVTGSVTDVATTTKPSGTDGTDYYTITPKLTTTVGSSKAKGKATISAAGYLATGNTTSEESSKSVGVTASQGGDYYLKASKSSDVTATVTASVSNITSINASQVTDGVTVTASASGSTVVPTGYYSTQVSKTPSNSASTTIKPKLAGTDGAIELTAGTSAFTKTSTADYSNGFITSVKVNPTPSEEQTATPSNTTQTVTPKAGKLLSKVTVNAIPSPYFDTSGVTATAGTVLKDYKFVNSSGTTVTGTIATATSSNVSGSVSGDNPGKITLTTEKTSGSSSTTATASATVAMGLYTGSSNIVADLTSKDFTATAEATLAASVTGTDKIPTTLPSGTVTITPNTDNTKRIYSDSTNKGFVTNIVLNAMDTSSVSSATTTDPGTDYTNKATVTPSTSAQYIKITKGYLPNSKITVSKMADGSISSATTTNPGDSYANRVTVTPSGTDAQYIKISKGYLPDGKITINKMSAGSVASATTTNPGDSYTNQTTVTPSGTDAQYVKISAGYLPNSKITVSKMADGSISSASTTNPGDSYTNQTTVTPSTSAQYVKVTAGYLPNSKITVEAIPNQKGKDDVTATVTAGVSNITSINASQVTDGVTVTASASGSTVVPVGYYSTQVSKTPSDSKSTTIKPKLAGTNGSIELTAGTSAFTKTSTADYSNGFITSVKVNPTPSETKEFTPTIAGDTISPAPGKLLSSVTVKGVPTLRLTLSSGGWGNSDSNVTAGKYYYDIFAPSITASNNLYVMPDDASAAQSFGVYAYSQSRLSEDDMGILQFRAMERPTSDLTYTVYRLS